MAASFIFLFRCASNLAGWSSRTHSAYALTTGMQDCNPANRGFGNFHWYRRDAAALEVNGVDFGLRILVKL